EPVVRQGGAVEVLVAVESGTCGEGVWGSIDDDATGPGESLSSGLRLRARLGLEVRRRAGDLLPGRRVELAGVLRAGREPAAADGFDERAELVREGASAYLVADHAWRLEGSALGPQSWIARLHRRARAAIREAGLERDEEAVVRAV